VFDTVVCQYSLVAPTLYQSDRQLGEKVYTDSWDSVLVPDVL
jgi:hypothetical protein